MGKSKILYGGEWVTTQALMNGDFYTEGICSKCKVQKLSCSNVFLNIKTKETRCLKHPPDCIPDWELERNVEIKTKRRNRFRRSRNG